MIDDIFVTLYPVPNIPVRCPVEPSGISYVIVESSWKFQQRDKWNFSPPRGYPKDGFQYLEIFRFPTP